MHVSCQRDGSDKCLATVTVDREGVGPEVHSLWAKLRSRPQLCSLEDKQTEVNPYHRVSKGILACGGKATLLKAEENSHQNQKKRHFRRLWLEIHTEQRTHMEASVQFSHSVLSLCDLMDCSMTSFPVHHQLLELNQTHVH